MISINITDDIPNGSIGGRFRTDSPYSGQWYREEILAPKLAKDKVCWDIYGAKGYPSSFFHEVIYGLVEIWGKEYVMNNLIIHGPDDFRERRIWGYVDMDRDRNLVRHDKTEV